MLTRLGLSRGRVIRRSLSLFETAYRRKISCNDLIFDERQFEILSLFSKMESALLTTQRLHSGVRSRGLYLFGNVGTGKTMLMDLFFSNSQVIKKRRVHFHKFMLEVHQRIHGFKQELLKNRGRDRHIVVSSERDAIAVIAGQISSEAQLLCFDEFQVLDICDALILTRLFNTLWSNGTVLVATSNRPPVDLYKDGLNRTYFLPFIDRIQQECIVRDLNGSKDYRMLSQKQENVFYTPLNAESRDLLYTRFLASGNGSPVCEKVVKIMMGRHITVLACGNNCYTSFRQLCQEDRFAADYQALCREFDTIFLDGVPRMTVKGYDSARRFITMIDEFYDAGVKMAWTAEFEPRRLFIHDLETLPDEAKLVTADAEVDNRRQRAHSVSGSLDEKFRVSRGAHIKDLLGTHDVKVPISPMRLSTNSEHFDAAQEALQISVGELAAVTELHFAFQRAASRMVEMSGREYWERDRKLIKINNAKMS